MTVNEKKMEERRQKARNLRYKRPALASLTYECISSELSEISEACSAIHYYVDGDGDSLLEALDGDVEEEYEFRMAFAELDAKVQQLSEQLYDNAWQDSGLQFDDCLVSLVGNRYRMVGFDGYEEDYYSLTSYEEGLAYTEAGERIMRMTKKEMLSCIGQVVGIAMAFLDIRQQYDYLRATMDVLRGENHAILQVVKGIEEAYEEANSEGFHEYSNCTYRLNRLIEQLPDRAWLE